MCKQFYEDKFYLKFAEPLVLFVFALAIRMSLLPYWKNLPLSGDEIFYWNYARFIADGNLMKNFLHPPLWTYVLSIPAAISDDSLYGRMLTVIISSVSVMVIYLLGKRLFGRKVGIIAGIIYSIYPNIIGFSHYLWPETLLSLLVLLSALFFFKSLGNEKKVSLLYLSFLSLSAGLLVKEFAIIPFGSMLLTLVVADLKNRKQMIVRVILIFLAPVIMYSGFASFLAKRPVMLADAFVYNFNEIEVGKAIWEKSTKENLEIFAGRVIELKKIPRRFINQVFNLWTPSSFPIFRLLKSGDKYRNVPNAKLIAYLMAGMYVLVVGLGLTGICCAEKTPFRMFSVANLLLFSSAGSLFLMCSRFRISFMYIFILYSSVVLFDFKRVIGRLTWRRALLLIALLALFAAIIVHGRSSFGYWG